MGARGHYMRAPLTPWKTTRRSLGTHYLFQKGTKKNVDTTPCRIRKYGGPKAPTPTYNAGRCDTQLRSCRFDVLFLLPAIVPINSRTSLGRASSSMRMIKLARTRSSLAHRSLYKGELGLSVSHCHCSPKDPTSHHALAPTHF